LIDGKGDAWVIDFNGGCTQGFVDEELAETLEGDLQGMSRLLKLLDC
jgi:hypothetical protein